MADQAFQARQAAQRTRVSSYMPQKPEIPGEYGLNRAPPPPIEAFDAPPPGQPSSWWALLALAGLLFVSLTLSI